MNRKEYLAAVNELMYQGETETKARLRPFMMRLGLSVVENDVSDQVAEFSKGFADKSWSELMQQLAEVTDFYATKFREIEAAAPDGEREVVRSMVVHEMALNDFAKRELTGDAENSLKDVISLLQWPIARSAQN
jgi:hypothetical protein